MQLRCVVNTSDRPDNRVWGVGSSGLDGIGWKMFLTLPSGLNFTELILEMHVSYPTLAPYPEEPPIKVFSGRRIQDPRTA